VYSHRRFQASSRFSIRHVSGGSLVQRKDNMNHRGRWKTRKELVIIVHGLE
jgi:hypothetical protein